LSKWSARTRTLVILSPGQGEWKQQRQSKLITATLRRSTFAECCLATFACDFSVQFSGCRSEEADELAMQVNVSISHCDGGIIATNERELLILNTFERTGKRKERKEKTRKEVATRIEKDWKNMLLNDGRSARKSASPRAAQARGASQWPSGGARPARPAFLRSSARPTPLRNSSEFSSELFVCSDRHDESMKEFGIEMTLQ